MKAKAIKEKIDHCREKYILILDEDETYLARKAEELSREGYEVLTARDARTARSLVGFHQPLYCILGFALRGVNNLGLIYILRSLVPDIKIVVTTAYGSVAMAVAAMQHGAQDYLPKSLRTAELIAALHGQYQLHKTENETALRSESTLALRRVEWEYIQRVLTECKGNISETARRLNVHRRTLQRKLNKHPVQERSHAVH